MSAPRLTVMIPTCRRPAQLAVAVRSIFAQQGFAPGDVELVVVDNDPAGSARAAFEALAAAAPVSTVYVHAPIPGVAQARNAGMAAARGEMVAFLDDDEEAPAHWLAALVAAQARHGAAVVFGPVRAALPAGIDEHRAYLEDFFSRAGPAEAGVIETYYGCGCSLLVRAAMPPGDKPFAAERDHIGGEDDLLFGTMKDRGARFAWEPAAWVWEHVPAARANLSYAVRRAFAYGQGPTAAAAAARPVRWWGVLGWMAQGSVQAAVFGLLAGLQWLIRSPARARTLDRAARGLGKLLWFGAFKIEFYGRSAAA
ncbi:MAG: glycosyltransferase [Caulobacteraceae bacterium]|nr:glycosyltransferase [Caulobacteraceae bacterium]